MGLALRKFYRTFSLHIRCENCLRETTRILDVPPGDDSPLSADELIESGFLRNMTFACAHCDSAIGQLFGISTGE
jgi:hypothetical protein